MKRENYHTKQKEEILDVIRKQNNEFTVKDIYEALNLKIGLTTIYRYVDKLVKKGILKKLINKDNTIYYQYLETCLEENHFYLKCEKCGHLTHIDCDCIEELTSHIKTKHHFKPDKENIIIYGYCEHCLGEC